MATHQKRVSFRLTATPWQLRRHLCCEVSDLETPRCDDETGCSRILPWSAGSNHRSHPELWDDERYRTNAGRVAARDELLHRLQAIFANDPRVAWIERFKVAGVPAAPILDLAGASADSRAAARGLQWNLQHPKLGGIAAVANALQHTALAFDGTSYN